MKHFLLGVLLLGCVGSARAQVGNLVGIGVVAGVKALQNRPQRVDAFVSQVTYQAYSFAQKRTPARKLPKPSQGGTEIVAIEHLLTTRYAALQADSTTTLLGLDQEKEFSRLRNNLLAFNPAWSADAYLAEMDFYRQQDVLRKRRAGSVAH